MYWTKCRGKEPGVIRPSATPPGTGWTARDRGECARRSSGPCRAAEPGRDVGGDARPRTCPGRRLVRHSCRRRSPLSGRRRPRTAASAAANRTSRVRKVRIDAWARDLGIAVRIGAPGAGACKRFNRPVRIVRVTRRVANRRACDQALETGRERRLAMGLWRGGRSAGGCAVPSAG